MEYSYKDSLIDAISDTYKDVYGIRPRSYNWDAMSVADLSAELDMLDAQLAFEIESDKARQAASTAEFEALVAKTIEMGARDRATALRWLSAQFDTLDEMEYELELPYGYLRRAA